MDLLRLKIRKEKDVCVRAHDFCAFAAVWERERETQGNDDRERERRKNSSRLERQKKTRHTGTYVFSHWDGDGDVS